MHVNF